MLPTLILQSGLPSWQTTDWHLVDYKSGMGCCDALGVVTSPDSAHYNCSTGEQEVGQHQAVSWTMSVWNIRTTQHIHPNSWFIIQCCEIQKCHPELLLLVFSNDLWSYHVSTTDLTHLSSCHLLLSQMNTTPVTHSLVLTADFSTAASLLVSSSPSHCIMKQLLSITHLTHSYPPLHICQISLNLLYSRVSHYLWSPEKVHNVSEFYDLKTFILIHHMSLVFIKL